jgi:hypothetical protein
LWSDSHRTCASTSVPDWHDTALLAESKGAAFVEDDGLSPQPLLGAAKAAAQTY